MKLLLLASWRHLRRRPLQALLCTLGVALGVSVIVALEMAIDSAERSFEVSVDTLGEGVSDRIVGPGTRLPAEVYRELVVEHGLQGAAPIIQRDVRTLGPEGRRHTLLGIDPYSEGALRQSLREPPSGEAPSVEALVARPGAAWMERGAAAGLGLELGDELPVTHAGRTHQLSLSGTFGFADPARARAVATLIVVDIATAQELIGDPDGIDAIEWDLGAGAEGDAERDRIRALLPPGARLVSAQEERASLSGLLAAFRMNLSLLGSLALVVGAFLIFNTMSFAVVERRALFGRFRARGLTASELHRAVLVEAFVVGAIGTALGILIGWALSRALVGTVAKTISDLYHAVEVSGVALDAGTLLKAAGIGLGTALVAAWWPAREAAKVSPHEVESRASLERTRGRSARKLVLPGALAILAALGVLLVPTRALWPCQLALVLLVVGFALWVPALTVLAVKLLEGPLGRIHRPVGKLAVRGVAGSLSRTAPAMAALAIALAMSIGVTIMIGSFRGALVAWLDGTLQADVYVNLPRGSARAPGHEAFTPELVQKLSSVEGVAGVLTNRSLDVPGPGGDTLLIAVSRTDGGPLPYRLIRGEAEGAVAMSEALARDEVVISEPLASRTGLDAGDAIGLTTARGEQAFLIAGVFRDFATERGYVVAGAATLARYWDDDSIGAMAFFRAEGTTPTQLESRLVAAGEGSGLEVRTADTLQTYSLEIFDRTFAVTAVLRTLAAIVAFVGFVGALLALELDRARMVAVLRARGLSPGETGLQVLLQTAVEGLIAGALAIPLGLSFAAVLTGPVNWRSFGWTLPYEVSPWPLLGALALSLSAAVVAAAWPALRLARRPLAEALREE